MNLSAPWGRSVLTKGTKDPIIKIKIKEMYTRRQSSRFTFYHLWHASLLAFSASTIELYAFSISIKALERLDSAWFRLKVKPIIRKIKIIDIVKTKIFRYLKHFTLCGYNYL
jgi:hypothetical protein